MAASITTPGTGEAPVLRPPESVFLIDIRGTIDPFQKPNLTEVIAAVEAAVPQSKAPWCLRVGDT